jgi:uncharacterized membrane protein YphA (DoxX/SURF4 family)
MTTRSIAYWITTSLIALETFAGGGMDLTHVVDLTPLGYPPYVLTILGVLKVPAAIVLLLPGLPRLKEWAYAGIVFELGVAAASQAASHRPPSDIATPLVLAALAAASWALRPSARTLMARASR